MNEEKIDSSENKNENGDEQTNHEQQVNEGVEANAQEDLKKELTPEEKYADLNDRFIRLYAEFDNYRKRTSKEKIELIGSANAGILKDLLPVMDDFERAILNNEKVDDILAVKEGFHLIFNKFRNTLEGKGLKPMHSKGVPFDAELHEAIANVPAPSADEVGKIIDDVEKGYYLHDKVIRFAKVVVGQ